VAQLRTAIYIRVSTDEQVKEGFSIPAQKDRLQKYAESMDWQISDFYIEEGVSAKNTDRPELQRLLQDIRQLKVDIVLVYRLDRLTRSVLDLYHLLHEFEKYNVKFKSATEMYDTTSALGRLFLTLVAALAQWERENLGERVRMGMEHMVHEEKRPGGPPPLGYILLNQKLAVHDEEALIIRFIFDRYLHGAGMNRIAQECNLLRFRTKMGKPFSKTAISAILQNPVYYGALRWNYREGRQKLHAPEDWIVLEDIHPPIISKETYDSACEILKRRKQRHPRQLASGYIFSGIAFCGRCGAQLTGHTIRQKNKGKEIRQYKCTNKKKGTCGLSALPEQTVEQLFIEKVKLAINHILQSVEESTFLKPAVQAKTPDPIKNQLQKITSKRTRLQLLFAEGLITLEEIHSQMRLLAGQEGLLINEEEKHIKCAVSSTGVQETDVWRAAVCSPATVWQYASEEEKRHMAGLLVKRIILYTDEEQQRANRGKSYTMELDFN
jgi:site-specific DNA recombinase